MRIGFDEAEAVMREKLIRHGAGKEEAETVAYEMARNSLEGTYTHGINRFPSVVKNIDDGFIIPGGKMELLSAFGSSERYDGNLGFGIVNARAAIDRAVELAESCGIAVVALRNTNHWLRAATYGLRAAERGFAAICFTNTLPNMPAWGGVDARIGNNPFMMAFPRENGQHFIVDSAMSQYSYGALEIAEQEGRKMPFPAGYDENGVLTDDPSAVIRSRRTLPAGYWKGSAMSILLDVFASSLSMGRSVQEIGHSGGGEYGVSQVFIAIDWKRTADEKTVTAIGDAIAADLKSSVPAGSAPIVYPGERLMGIKERNLRDGIPVDERVWKNILSL